MRAPVAAGGSLKEHIRRLVRLQDILFEIRSLEVTTKTYPEKLEAVDQELQTAVNEIGQARVRHESLLVERTRLHRERDELSTRLQQLQQKLMQVSNQREYSAALNEIDFAKHQLSALEERSQRLTSEIEELSGPASEADARVAEERTRIEAQKSSLAEEREKVERKLSDLVQIRDLIVKELPANYFGRFESIFKARGGVAVSKIVNDACSACRMRLRPHLINQVRLGSDLVTCDSCRRILYVGEFGDDGGASSDEDSEGRLVDTRTPALGGPANTSGLTSPIAG
jgi:hypothetical protein